MQAISSAWRSAPDGTAYCRRPRRPPDREGHAGRPDSTASESQAGWAPTGVAVSGDALYILEVGSGARGSQRDRVCGRFRRAASRRCWRRSPIREGPERGRNGKHTERPHAGCRGSLEELVRLLHPGKKPCSPARAWPSGRSRCRATTPSATRWSREPGGGGRFRRSSWRIGGCDDLSTRGVKGGWTRC